MATCVREADSKPLLYSVGPGLEAHFKLAAVYDETGGKKNMRMLQKNGHVSSFVSQRSGAI